MVQIAHSDALSFILRCFGIPFRLFNDTYLVLEFVKVAISF